MAHSINRTERLHVARRLLYALLLLSLPALAEPVFPSLTGRVMDAAGLLSAESVAALTEVLEAHEAETTNQVVVVTVADLQGYDIADFAVRLGRHWQIGQATANNGVLLLVAAAERKVRIEVGYGLEGTLTDAISADIIQRKILPLFREGDYVGGVQQGINGILTALKTEYQLPAQPQRSPDADTDNRYFPLFFIGMIAVFEVLKRFGYRRQSNTAFPAALIGLGVTAITQSLLFGSLAAAVLFVVLYFLVKPGNVNAAGGVRSRPRPGLTRTHGGFEETGGSIGGGGGFSGGGGSFGGGGASGSW